MTARIRIESHEDIVGNARIFYVEDGTEPWECRCPGAEGKSWLALLQPGTKAECEVCGATRPSKETDISSCVTGVDLHLHVGEIARASLHVILVRGSVTAEPRDVIVKKLSMRRPLWRIRRAIDRTTGKFKRWLKQRIARSLSPELQRELAKSARRRGGLA